MAITVTYTPNELADGQQFRGTKLYIGSIAGPASYATGGFTADAIADFGISLAAIQSAVVTSDAGYTATFNADYNKILAYVSGGTEVTATTNLSSVEFTIHIFVNNGTV